MKRTKRLREVCRVVPGFAFKSTQLGETGIPVVKIGSITEAGNVDLVNGQFLPLEQLEDRHRKYFLTQGDIVMAMTGEGKVGRITDHQESLLNQRVCRLDPIDEADRAYLWVVVKSMDYSRLFAQLAQGAAQANISGGQIEALSVEWPEPDVREKIADVALAYDDLIENNRRRIALLEQSARLLYREWFVHLRFPGHEHVNVVDGVPEGWIKSPIRSRFKTVLGGTPSRKRVEYWEGGTIPWINSGMVNEVRIAMPSELITPLALAESAAKMMPTKTTVLAITGATLGQVSMLEIECAANQSVVGVIDESGMLAEYIYLALKDRAKELIGLGTGGAQVHINKDIVNAFEVVLPDDGIAREIKGIVGPLFSQVACLLMTNLRLERARDLLLPRLMNGDLVI